MDEPKRARRINPQNPMRVNRWRKMKQQVRRVSVAGAGPSDPVAGISPTESVPGTELL